MKRGSWPHPGLIGAMMWIALFSVAASGCGDAEEEKAADEPIYVPPDPDVEGSWILVDRIHTDKQNPDLKLEKGNYNYQGMHGYHRLFTHLAANGYPYRQIYYDPAVDTRLTREILKDYKILFINLVSSEKPDFTQDEIQAIQEWTFEGGGLYVVADHTNVYYHAQRVNPILAPMGIEVTYHTAADQPPEYALNSFWTKIRNFSEHPTTEGVSVMSFQTGGPMRTEHGVAFLSDNGFGDFWEEDPSDPGFYGNGVLDPGEPTGRLPVVAAAEYGEGRVFIVGDQNVFGDEWVLVGNNWEAALNGFEWVAKNEGATPNLRDIPLQDDHFVVGVELAHSNWNIGTNGCFGYFPFFINFNRDPEVAARGVESMTNAEHALVFTDPGGAFTEQELAQVQTYLQSGKTVLLLTDVVRAGAGSKQLLKTFAPQLRFTGKEEFGVDDLPADDAKVETVTSPAEWPVRSTELAVTDQKVSGHVTQGGFDCSPDATWTSYVRAFTVSGGTSLAQLDVDGTLVDFIRVFDVEGGRFVVVLQDGVFRNETLGWERYIPTAEHADAHELQFLLLDWMKSKQ